MVIAGGAHNRKIPDRIPASDVERPLARKGPRSGGSSYVHVVLPILKFSMKPVFAFLALCGAALAQAPPGQQQKPPEQPSPRPPQVIVSQGTQQGPSITLNLQQALGRAGTYSQQVYSADFAARLAHEDAVQAKAALLPTAQAQSAYIYTQPNGTTTDLRESSTSCERFDARRDLVGPIRWPRC